MKTRLLAAAAATAVTASLLGTAVAAHAATPVARDMAVASKAYLTVSTGKVAAGETMKARVQTHPSQAGKTVTLDLDNGGTLIRISSGVTGKDGAVAFTIDPVYVTVTGDRFVVSAENMRSAEFYSRAGRVPGRIPSAAGVPGNRQMQLVWSPASGAGDYRVYYRIKGTKTFTQNTRLVTAKDTHLYTRVTGLKNNKAYEFRIVPHNQYGNGKAETVFATPKRR